MLYAHEAEIYLDHTCGGAMVEANPLHDYEYAHEYDYEHLLSETIYIMSKLRSDYSYSSHLIMGILMVYS
eukprot:4547079-Prymnesium_polylepis.1